MKTGIEVLTLFLDITSVITDISSFISSDSDFKFGIIIFGYFGKSSKEPPNLK